MEILAISSSPRRNGNSETLLDKSLSAVKKKDINVKKVILTDLKIAPCNSCGDCFETGECSIKDDMQTFYDDLLACDCLLIASPMYFQGLPCQLKCAIDRCQALWAKRYVLKKDLIEKSKKAERRGAAILVCASSGMKNTFTGALITLKAWFSVLDIRYKKEFLKEGLEDKSAALQDKMLLEKVGEFSKSLI